MPTIPLTNAQLAILDECIGHHPTYVFTYAAERSRRGFSKGERRPITDVGFKTHWRRYVRDAGIAPGFRRHDTRHTAGTRYVRATGNLKGAQRLLGHSRIETTTRYAHVLLEDIRAGQEAVEATQSRSVLPLSSTRMLSRDDVNRPTSKWSTGLPGEHAIINERGS